MIAVIGMPFNVQQNIETSTHHKSMTSFLLFIFFLQWHVFSEKQIDNTKILKEDNIIQNHIILW